MSFDKLKRNHDRLVTARQKPSTKLNKDAAAQHLFELFTRVKDTIWRNTNGIKFKSTRQKPEHYSYEVDGTGVIHIWVVPDKEIHITCHPYEDAVRPEAILNHTARYILTEVQKHYPQYENCSQYVVV